MIREFVLNVARRSDWVGAEEEPLAGELCRGEQAVGEAAVFPMMLRYLPGGSFAAATVLRIDRFDRLAVVVAGRGGWRY